MESAELACGNCCTVIDPLFDVTEGTECTESDAAPVDGKGSFGIC